MRVLIVEDNHKFRAFAVEYLFKLFETVLECGDGDAAMEIYVAERPEVVLMDIALEGKTNGIAATRRIVNFDPSAKVIMVTSYEGDDLRQAAETAGAVGYVLKRDLSLLGEILKGL